jgi:hypothetical protein
MVPLMPEILFISAIQNLLGTANIRNLEFRVLSYEFWVLRASYLAVHLYFKKHKTLNTKP